MKLTHVRIKDFRSFSGEHIFDLADGANYFVGPNNCGKSNLIRALELALDPDVEYVPDRDRPMKDAASGGRKVTTRITLTFEVGKSSTEKTLLTYAQAYERLLTAKSTYAEEGQIHFVTTFTSPARQASFQAKRAGARSAPVESKEHQLLLRQFHSLVRFAVIHSGEDLESLLQGKFLEILHLVIEDHLSTELQTAAEARDRYVGTLQKSVLEPLRSRIQGLVGGIFPEITAATLIPDVPTVEQTLSSVEILLGDLVPTQLADKGTGVRGAVLLSMLQYLAEESRRSLVLAVEEPEAFLHPAAQESVCSELEQLAARSDVSVLTTTHSPYVISRSAQASVTELRKNHEGFTERARSAMGNDSRAELLGSLFRDPAMSAVIDRSLQIPPTATAIVVTEGYTDDLFLRLVLDATGQATLLDGFVFVPAGKAEKVVLQAIAARAASSVPVIALLDFDDQGRAARDKLKAFQWSTTRDIIMLGDWPGACAAHPDVEIEDLLPSSAIEKLIARVGDAKAIEGWTRCDPTTHRRYSSSFKDEAIVSLEKVLPKSDAGGMLWLAEVLVQRATKMSGAAARAAEYMAAGTR
ncbi:ATP-dependent endonuclease [Nocardioides sp. LS1]|uniref:ATP-dependent nuclease n=1 Tax=Nocardioides sp. LS1 TaxID=1027620 RepID=UPI000F61E73A|nr:AAA family ATPase [Nocardioides sp. LS1]GCD90180.1 hypothetical protein NLS1_21860 [Nocardioides sp. LS1]